MNAFRGNGNRKDSSASQRSRNPREKEQQEYWPTRNLAADPNDLIDSIVDAIDYAEIARDNHGLIKARRLLNNDLRQAIDLYVQDEIQKALGSGYRLGHHRKV
jgi:hypothetical protein